MLSRAKKIRSFVDKCFSTRQNAEYDSRDYTDLLLRAASFNTYVETVKVGGKPDADSLHYHLHDKSELEGIRSAFGLVTKEELRELSGKQAIVIFDVTNESFYGSTTNPWIHGHKPDPGTTGCFKLFTASVLAGEKRYFLDSKLLNIFSDPVKEVLRVLSWLREHNIKIRVVLFDRGLTSSTLLRMLKSENVNYLGLCPKYENIKRIILDMDKTDKFVLRQEFEVNGVGTKLVIVREEKWDWTFVTNMEFKHAAKYIRLYRKRWNIETGFRVQDEARIKTKSTNPIIRYFYFLVSALLYNLWKLLSLGIPFKRLLIEFCGMWGGEGEIWEPG
jgi:hypothetical protein